MLLPLGNSLWPHGPSLAGLYFSIMEVTPVHCTALWEDVISLGLLQAGILQGKRELIGGALGFNLLNIHLPLSFLLTFPSSYWIRNWISLKLSSAEFMINLSIQNFIPFLVPPHSLQNWGIRKGGDWSQAGPCGPSQAQKSLCDLHFFLSFSK